MSDSETVPSGTFSIIVHFFLYCNGGFFLHFSLLKQLFSLQEKIRAFLMEILHFFENHPLFHIKQKNSEIFSMKNRLFSMTEEGILCYYEKKTCKKRKPALCRLHRQQPRAEMLIPGRKRSNESSGACGSKDPSLQNKKAYDPAVSCRSDP